MLSVRDKLMRLEREVRTLKAEVESLKTGGVISVSPERAAKAVGISVTSLRYRLQTGRIPSHVATKIGNRWIVHLRALEQHLFQKGGEHHD